MEMEPKKSKPTVQRTSVLAACGLIILLGQPQNTLAQWTNGTNINNTNTGNVGIGTAAPGSKLEVQANVQWIAKFKKTGATKSGITIDSASGYNPNVADVGYGTEMRHHDAPPSIPTIRLRTVLNGPKGKTSWVTLSPDGRLTATSEGKDIKIWDTHTGNLEATLTKPGEAVGVISFGSDGHLLLAPSLDKTLKLWEVGFWRLRATLAGHKGHIWSSEFSSDGKRIVTASGDETAKLWDATTGRLIATLNGHKNFSMKAEFSPDGQMIATTSGWGHSAIRLWDGKTGALKATIKSQNGADAPRFSGDGRTLVTTTVRDEVELWDMESFRLRDVLRGHRWTIYYPQVSPDGRTLATPSADGTARLWDIKTGEALKILYAHKKKVYRVDFSLDGRALATAGEEQGHEAKLWDVKTGRLIGTVTGFKDHIWDVDFSPDSRLVVFSSDSLASVWDTKTGELVGRLEGAHYPVTFSPDGRTIATIGPNKTALLWDISK
jgi:WD40 repeat protein